MARLAWCLALSLGAPVASGAEPREAWEAVHRLRAQAALSSQLRPVLQAWMDLASAKLPADSPSLGQALYELGELRWTAGDIRGARDALDQCVRQTPQRSRCAELRGAIDLEVDAVRSVPVHWTFDDADHGLYHPRIYWDRGALKLSPTPAGEGTLRWQKRIDASGADHLVAGLDRPSPVPRRLRLDISSEALTARLEVRLEDDLGRSTVLSPSPVRVEAGERVQVTFAFPSPSQGSGPVHDAGHPHRLYLIDLTDLEGVMGTNTLVLYDLILE